MDKTLTEARRLLRSVLDREDFIMWYEDHADGRGCYACHGCSSNMPEEEFYAVETFPHTQWCFYKRIEDFLNAKTI